MSGLARLVPLVLGVALIPSASYAPARPITALAPIEILAAGFGSLQGVAVDAAGNVYVADREADTVTRIAPDRSQVVVAAGLGRPVGLAFDPDGRLLIAEERAGRVVRIEADGRRTPVLSGLARPRWLAVSDTGRLFVSARRLARDGDREPDDESAELDDESAERDVILTAGAAGRPTVFADGLERLQGLATGESVVYAASRGRRGEDPRAEGVIFRIPVLADGTAGVPTRLGPTFERPIALGLDRLTALWVTAKRLHLDESRAKRVVGKLQQDGTVTLFASDLDDPRGLAFDADGHLYVADGHAGRIVRFRAPPAPRLDALPAYTNRSAIDVRGTTEPSARVDVFAGDDTAAVLVADAAGEFAVPVTLVPNTEDVLEIFATGHAGAGLTSASAEARITHDDIPPSLVLQAPPAGGYVRLGVSVQARASDGGSGLETLVFTVDGQPLEGAVSPALPAPSATVTAQWFTTAVPDGTHTVGVSATDRAGNPVAARHVVIVDNTAPETWITGGPTGTTQDTTATFTFTGADALTAATSLAFAWRLDEGPWSAFGPATSATVSGLAQGPHFFEVTARDLAGNEDPTPAQASFTVGALRVTITEPTDGATVPAGLLLVRGTVEAGGMEIGIIVNGIAAAVQGMTFSAQVPITTETTNLTAVVMTATGTIADHSIALAVSSTAAMPVLQAVPATGIAPLTVAFSVESASAPAEVELDADGDGWIDVVGPDLDGQAFVYTRPGLYVATATIADGQGGKTTARALVQVYDRVSLDAALRAKWTGLKAALRAGDVSRGLEAVALSARDDYRDLLTALGPRLATIDTILTDIDAIAFHEEAAEYQMIRVDGGVRLSYFVLFVRDGDGIWRLKFF